MQEQNTFERLHLRGVLNEVCGAAVRAKRCSKCLTVYFVNYKGNDYICTKCRGTDPKVAFQ